jgi:hypothetical protein
MQISMYLDGKDTERYRQLLEEAGIQTSDENVKKLARYLVRQPDLLSSSAVRQAFESDLVYGAEIKSLQQLATKIKRNRERYYPNEPKYQEPPMVKLIRATADFATALEQYKSGKVKHESVIYELDNILYYNVQNFSLNHDEQSHNGVVEMFSEQAGVTPKQGLATAIAKYQQRMEDEDLHYRDRDTAFKREIAAIEQAMTE